MHRLLEIVPLYHRDMVKGITLVRGTRTAADFEALASFFAALGFEPGKGWADDLSRGAPFLAPLAGERLLRHLGLGEAGRDRGDGDAKRPEREPAIARRR